MQKWTLTLYIGLALSLITVRLGGRCLCKGTMKLLYCVLLWTLTIVICACIITYQNHELTSKDPLIFTRACASVLIANFVGYMLLWNVVALLGANKISYALNHDKESMKPSCCWPKEVRLLFDDIRIHETLDIEKVVRHCKQ